jgi:hypothetical protein
MDFFVVAVGGLHHRHGDTSGRRHEPLCFLMA